MIKKLLTLALMLLLVPCLALAESYQSYAAEDGSLSFLYPEDWLLLSKENIDSVLDAAATVEGVAEMAEAARTQIEQMGMIVLVDETGLNNINLQLQDTGMELSGDTLMALAPSLQSAIEGSLEGVTFHDPELMDINGTDALLMQCSYTLARIDFQQLQAYMSMGTRLAVVTLTCSSEDRFSAGAETLGVILGSLS